MTDPLRRDPREFKRVLRTMANRSSWHKTMLMASRGRLVGFQLTVDHYNSILFSQALWGRALEIVQVIRAMDDDQVRLNGISYYYICHGMANADHGMDMTGFEVNQGLKALQHWRIAINALEASDKNGFDPTETMFNSAVVSCVVPGIDRWKNALAVVHEMRAREMKLHPQAVQFLEKSLVRSQRVVEATRLRNWAAESEVHGYEGKAEPDFYANLPNFNDGDVNDPQYEAEQRMLMAQPAFRSEDSVFRPRVYRQLWWKWHGIANKYKPNGILRKRQISPKDSPSGIPGFFRL